MIATIMKLYVVYKSFSSFISYKMLYQMSTLLKFSYTVYMVYIYIYIYIYTCIYTYMYIYVYIIMKQVFR